MSQLSSRVRRLRHEIHRVADAGRGTKVEIEHIQDRVADLLLRALWDEYHALSEQLIALQERVKLERQGKLYRPPKDPGKNPLLGSGESLLHPNRHLFMPHPGNGDPESRRHWQLQLLLQTAARSNANISRLAERLGLSSESLKQAADAGARYSTGLWSVLQYVQHLEQAVGALDSVDPPLPFRLVDRTVQAVSGGLVHLSPQEARFLKMLTDRLGKPVTNAEFVGAGILHPAKVKGEIVKKFNAAEIDLPTQSPVGAYLLLES
ncbi:MAG TPA: hypothetical protein VG326_15080 [Tepidisphaeraceae bacterium]|jgi:hypothetical protein|nr:hypothetical protein [Tepidisphaeraceae bacterium]